LAAVLRQIDVCRCLRHDDADLSTLADKVSVKVADFYAAMLSERPALWKGNAIPRNTETWTSFCGRFPTPGSADHPGHVRRVRVLWP
jgi:hypothetical protein